MESKPGHVRSPVAGLPGREHRSVTGWAIGLLVLLAALLRFYQLGSQLWLDEIVALVNSYREPFWTILTRFPAHFPHPLFEQLAHGSLALLGESAFSIRLPAAIFGVADVIMLYKLSRRGSGEGESFLAGALLCLSSYHVYYSQDARGYTLYLFLALAATDRLLALLEHMRWRTALAYSVLAAFAAYAQTAGLTLAIGQVGVALFLVGRPHESSEPNRPNRRQLAGILAISIGITLLLYGPIVIDSIGHAAAAGKTERALGAPARMIDLVMELMRSSAPSWWSGALVFAALLVSAIGCASLIRTAPAVLAMLIVPVLLSLGVTIVVGAAIHPRYSLLLMMALYLMAARGLTIVARKLFRPELRRARALFLAVAVAVSGFPLLGYYSCPKQDFLGALHDLRAVKGSGERLAGLDMIGVFTSFYRVPDVTVLHQLPDLLELENTGTGVWVVTTLESVERRRRPEMIDRLDQQYVLERVIPGSTGDGEMRLYHRSAAGGTEGRSDR